MEGTAALLTLRIINDLSLLSTLLVPQSPWIKFMRHNPRSTFEGKRERENMTVTWIVGEEEKGDLYSLGGFHLTQYLCVHVLTFFIQILSGRNHWLKEILMSQRTMPSH